LTPPSATRCFRPTIRRWNSVPRRHGSA